MIKHLYAGVNVRKQFSKIRKIFTKKYSSVSRFFITKKKRTFL